MVGRCPSDTRTPARICTGSTPTRLLRGKRHARALWPSLLQDRECADTLRRLLTCSETRNEEVEPVGRSDLRDVTRQLHYIALQLSYTVHPAASARAANTVSFSVFAPTRKASARRVRNRHPPGGTRTRADRPEKPCIHGTSESFPKRLMHHSGLLSKLAAPSAVEAVLPNISDALTIQESASIERSNANRRAFELTPPPWDASPFHEDQRTPCNVHPHLT